MKLFEKVIVALIILFVGFITTCIVQRIDIQHAINTQSTDYMEYGLPFIWHRDWGVCVEGLCTENAYELLFLNYCIFTIPIALGYILLAKLIKKRRR